MDENDNDGNPFQSEQTPRLLPKLQRETMQPSTAPKPILVLGATGRIGRRVVRQLMNSGFSVRAFVRDYEKALDLLGKEEEDGSSKCFAEVVASRRRKDGPALRILVGDLVPLERVDEDDLVYDSEEPPDRNSTIQYYDDLEAAIRGCSTVISCVGTVRRSKVSDFFPPWRIFRKDVSSWCRDKHHPYYVHYLATKALVALTEKEQQRQQAVQTNERERFIKHRNQHQNSALATTVKCKIVLISDLCVVFPPYGLVATVTNILRSMIFRYQDMAEHVLRKSNVHSVILRPGDLVDEERNPNSTSLQVDPSGFLPSPSIVGRSDVAALAIAAAQSDDDRNYTLAVRWSGDDLFPYQSQGHKSNGWKDAAACMKMLQRGKIPPKKVQSGHGLKPYGLYVSFVVYSITALLLRSLFFVSNPFIKFLLPKILNIIA